MQTTKKKPSLIFILVGAVLAGYLGYLINGAWSEGVAFNEFMNRFNEVCAAPFANYYNTNTIKAVAIALGIYAMAIVMYYTSQRNYMPGKEFGTARFENPKQVNKILADKDENFNRILSQNVKISLDFRRLKLNGNILICGGSGAGKTFYEVKPNLMQMPHNCSFICTDPKGEILRSCGQMLKNNGGYILPSSRPTIYHSSHSCLTPAILLEYTCEHTVLPVSASNCKNLSFSDTTIRLCSFPSVFTAAVCMVHGLDIACTS